jgi:hydroxymethylpyrimidine/phosphomethylpyrimidine kinase
VVTITLPVPAPIPNVLTIAGSDSGGGAGIQADLKTFSALGVYGASVITALTAQNTRGVRALHVPDAAFVTAQLDAVFEDIRIDAVKIGMLANVSIVRAVADALRRYRPPRVVLDTVMLSKNHHALLAPEAIAALRDELLPLADVITPNLPEAAALLGKAVATDEAGMVRQGKALLGAGARAVLMKGGHLGSPHSPDWLVQPDKDKDKGSANMGTLTLQLDGARIAVTNTHGTGCTLSAAIAALWAQRAQREKREKYEECEGLAGAVREAKAYLNGALAASDQLCVGTGVGPVQHFYRWW